MAPIDDEVRKLELEQLAKQARSLSDALSKNVSAANSGLATLLTLNAKRKLQVQSLTEEFKVLNATRTVNQTRLTELRNDIIRLRAKASLTKAEEAELRNSILSFQRVRNSNKDLAAQALINRAELKNSNFEMISSASQVLAQGMTAAAQGLRTLMNKIYQIQQDIGVQIGTATEIYKSAIMASIGSYFSLTKPILDPEDITNAYKAFIEEFGTILAPDEAEKIAVMAKRAGTSAAILVKAERAFLTAGGSLATMQKTYADEFVRAGLTEAAALKFAAENANLVAIAGSKYASELARAAAYTARIGVSLSKTEQFADNFVADFEGALERFAELSALGVNVEFNTMAQAVARGPQEVVNELSRQLGGNKAVLTELQNNRFLKVALERDLGLNIAEITRIARGEEALPAQKTVEEQQVDLLSKILEVLSKGAQISKFATAALSGAAAGARLGMMVPGVGMPVGAIAGGVLGGITSLFGGMAQGGLVTGPGTSTSDSVPKMLSSGEYVLSSDAVRNVGTDTLNKLNTGKFPVDQLPSKPKSKTLIDTLIAISGGGNPTISRENEFENIPETLKNKILSDFKNRGYNRLTGILEGRRASYNSIKDRIYIPKAAGDINNLPTDSPIRRILIHEFMHRRDAKGMGLPEKMLLFPTEMRNKLRMNDTSDSNYGQVNKAEAYAVAGETAMNMLDAAEYLKSTFGMDVAKVTSRKNFLNNLVRKEMRYPGTGTILMDLLQTPEFSNNPLHEIIFGKTKKSPSILDSFVKKYHNGGMVGGTGEVPAMLNAGEYVVNPKSTQAYGTEFLNNINKGVYTPQAATTETNVNVDMSSLETKLDKLVKSLSGMKVEMDGHTTGHISWNAARSPIRTL
jgi:hypothetical protein